MTAPSEHAFLRERLTIVERQLANPDRKSIPASGSGVRRRMEPPSWQDLTYKREARLLLKLLAQTREGQVLMTTRAWRQQLGGFLVEHRQRYREMQDAYDAWWELPRDKRETAPKPPKPPSVRYIDHEGAPWIVDDRFLVHLG